MAFLDSTVVNVALPVMQQELGATVDGVQWIVEAYALLLASLVLVGGALGDRLGRRRVFITGVVLFSVASAGCGVAPTLVVLVVARAVQGIGAALLIPGSLSLISAAYPEEKRGAAIGTWSAASAVTSAVGPVAGGWVVAHASWRWLFFLNVPLGALVVAFSTTRVGETRDPDASPHLDLAGAALVTMGLALVVYALVESQRAGGLGSTWVASTLLLGVLLLVAFVLTESQRPAPMVPLSLFRSRTFAGANLLTMLLYAALGGALFFVPFDLIQVQRSARGRGRCAPAVRPAHLRDEPVGWEPGGPLRPPPAAHRRAAPGMRRLRAPRRADDGWRLLEHLLPWHRRVGAGDGPHRRAAHHRRHGLGGSQARGRRLRDQQRSLPDGGSARRRGARRTPRRALQRRARRRARDALAHARPREGRRRPAQ
jgi:MFS family permease